MCLRISRRYKALNSDVRLERVCSAWAWPGRESRRTNVGTSPVSSYQHRPIFAAVCTPDNMALSSHNEMLS